VASATVRAGRISLESPNQRATRLASPPPMLSAATPRPRGLLLYLKTAAKLFGIFSNAIEVVE
jgi:hypothetical protein